ncbi:hypothetical protein [Limnobacter parvus]|uniref:Cobalt transporter n=1 Tax=Limnobacter parvus TaxID=2939690 RepID=A0ABT1XJ83_9BURK|nr:hypothetical protein [Limnobacter parvus]MCR2747342.1 hypothetical protein [Limnobacter parvus]
MLIALTLVAAQWVGLAHSIEHREQLQAESLHSHGHEHTAHNDPLHSCLLFDGLASAQAAVSNPPTSCALPLLNLLGTQHTASAAPRNTLFAQRVRVRDPPAFPEANNTLF